MTKRLCAAILCALLALFMAASAENLIQNAEFEEDFAFDGVTYWDADAWDIYLSSFDADTVDGYVCLHIKSEGDNDARWIQTVEVEPNSTYLLSGYIMASGCSTGGNAKGANISIFNTDAYSDSIYETNGLWQYVELYGRTAADQTELIIALRIGGFSATGTGEAWFRDISFIKTEAPEGVSPTTLATFEPVVSNDSSRGTVVTATTTTSNGKVMPERQTLKWIIVAVIFSIVFFEAYIIAKWHARKQRQARESKALWKYAEVFGLIIIFLGALALRIYYAFKVRGYVNDIDCFMYWGALFRTSGFSFYANDVFHDYPPVYMMLLGLIDALKEALNIASNSSAHVFLIKLIPILSDFVTAGFVYGISRKRLGALPSVLLFAAIALNPAYIFDSAAWGQVDSLLTLLLVLTVYFGIKGSWHIALPIYAVAILTKPQALMFGPIGLVAVVADSSRSMKQTVKAAIGFAAAIIVFYLISVPFAVNEWRYAPDGAMFDYVVKWPWVKLLGTAQSYSYITINACNLYVLLGKNWAALSGAYGSDKFRYFAWFMFFAAYIYAALVCVGRQKRKSVKPTKPLTGSKNLALAGTVLISVLYTFAPMMHERYLFPALALSLLAYRQFKDRRLLYYFAVVSVTQFLNIALVLEWGGYSGMGNLQESEQTINAIISALNIAATLFICWTAFDLTLGWRLRSRKKSEKQRLKLKSLEGLWFGLVIVIYSVVAFTNLGSMHTPVTGYESTFKNEQIVFDLGEVKTYRMSYYGGISSNYFTVSLSNDGESWTEENAAEYGEGYMYKWIWYVPKDYSTGTFVTAYKGNVEIADTGEGGAYVTYPESTSDYPLQTSRYIRITVADEKYYSTTATKKLVLNEVVFSDPDTGVALPIVSISGSVPTADYSVLIDEQDTVAIPSYYSGMYFDEIYHARTAYELLNGYKSDNILEWSHPHLGKLIIAIGIKLFGMTPFGWRFSGTLFGVLMLPLIYLLIKQLTGKNKLALIGMTLLALDSMHFTQTRIATVDTYAVFFIMLMYLFMIRYFQMDLLKEKLWKTLIPLSLSGLFMGFAWASKWTGIYASAGLALMFFIKLGLTIKQYYKTKRRPKPNDVDSMSLTVKIMLTLDVCIVMFVAVPVMIYYFSYYWHFKNSGGLTFEKVWQLQQQMYSYHSGIVDNHYFKSPWYEWPLVIWPMWYFSSDVAYLGKGVVSSISLMGNPAVWWTGIFSMVVCTGVFLMQKKKDARLGLTILGFASQYLPWVLVPRSTYIYHYFTSVPFIIMATVLAIDCLRAKYRRAAVICSIVLMVSALALFIMFYPLESGYPCSYDYAKILRWFDWYNFALQ